MSITVNDYLLWYNLYFQTVSAMTSFFLAMVLYPAVLERAQEEVDCVVGNDRLPSFSDREKMPYIDALVKETFRWEVIAPIGPLLNLTPLRSIWY